ncbi:DEAD/DEAH box helicase family protein [Histomonas meleagridis]|uniref:DEAD/DEAH box helicase family protein n=1 Tax=Histomonas meleagridis TaxID=135588 RepID=UPI00355ABA65|nr:DEAD/DEAH box helicase family protein [Histomonas meleagridis]KAH0800466.1 DEAD/DEAH box helicase family protein [Histomonas meleagridis]
MKKLQSKLNKKTKKETTEQNKQEPIDYDTTDEMGNLLIPDFLQHSYIHGDPPITKLRDWQVDVLSTEDWSNKKNCVIVAPTSGGKTLVAEVAIAQLLEDEPYSKAIYALPFVALASEKYNDFKTRFPQYQVKPYFQNIGGSDFSRGSIAICTYEKAHSLLNSSIKYRYDHKIKLVIIDEAHMIGDDSRGTVAESLFMKLMAMRHPPQIISLTATLNETDARKLSTCIHGYHYFCSLRSVDLQRFISNNGQLFQCNSDGTTTFARALKNIRQDHDYILPMIREVLLQHRSHPSVLIFANTRNDAKRIALFISGHITDNLEGMQQFNNPPQEIIDIRNQLIHELTKSPGGRDNNLASCISKGVAFHHAGLLLEERKIIESGMKNGALSVVVATTTLSAGINIHSVSRVIIHSPYRKTDGKKILITSSLFSQMSGRAGRIQGINGDVIVISRSSQEFTEIQQMLNTPIPSLTTIIKETDKIDSAILQALSLGLATDLYTLNTYISTSFELSLNEQNIELIKSAINRLISQKLIETKHLQTTILGNAITVANFSIEEGLMLYDIIDKMMSSLCLVDDLHIVYLCTPSQTGVYIPSFNEQIWDKIINSHWKAIHLITNYSKQELQKIFINSIGGYRKLNLTEINVFERIYSASILLEIIEEKPINIVETVYKTDRGTIQALQSNAASFAGQITRFTEALGYFPLAASIQQFRQRLSYGIKAELIGLMSISAMRKDFARILYDEGIQSLNDIAMLNIEKLKEIISNNLISENGISDDELNDIVKSIYDEAKEVSEQFALLEEYEEESTWRKVLVVN